MAERRQLPPQIRRVELARRAGSRAVVRYQLTVDTGTNTILNADCLKALPMLPDGSVNFILTDPPYITRYRSRDGRTIANDDNEAQLGQVQGFIQQGICALALNGVHRTEICEAIAFHCFDTVAPGGELAHRLPQYDGRLMTLGIRHTFPT